jgi:hypothetical protein
MSHPTPSFIEAAEVAALIGLTDGPAFLRRRRALEAQGFPAPFPSTARPRRWRRDSVLAWAEAAARLAEQGLAPAVAGAAANDLAHLRAVARAAGFVS